MTTSDRVMMVIIALLGFVALVFFRLFVITQVWGYIAVGMFGAQPIGMWKAWALSMLVSIIIGRLYYEKYKGEDSAMHSLKETGKSILYTAFGWFFAWLFFV